MRLQPPLAPLRPGSYDFGRDMYFQGIGASGFVTGTIKTVEAPGSGGLSLRYAAFMQGLRDAIDARIRTALDGDRRAIATALLTGRRDAISPPVNDAMFISGLGHVLSISGYHMAVVAGKLNPPTGRIRSRLVELPDGSVRSTKRPGAADVRPRARDFGAFLDVGHLCARTSVPAQRSPRYRSAPSRS